MSHVQGVFKMQMRDKFSMIYLPLLILFASWFINVVVASFVDISIYSGGITAIYIYMFVCGIVLIVQSFPFALGFSVRRKDYFWGTAAAFVFVSLLMSVILTVVTIIEQATDGWMLDLHFYSVIFFQEVNWLAKFWIFFSVFLFMFFSGAVIPSIQKRFGTKVLVSTGLVLFLLGGVFAVFATQHEWWMEIFEWMINFQLIHYANILFSISVLFAWLTNLFLRKSTI